MRLPRKPQYVRVELDTDMVPARNWPGRERVLVFHYLGDRSLKRGARVCVNSGNYAEVFGTVLGRAWRYSGHTHGLRRAHRKTITVQVPRQIEVEVA
jgi:hypothetical protein